MFCRCEINRLYDSCHCRPVVFVHSPLTSGIIACIALAGTWCAPGIREGGGDLPPWYERHGPEGARQAGMPGGDGQTIGRLCDGGRRSTVRPGPLEYLVADSDVCPAECGDRHRTGAEAQGLPSPDAKGSGWVERPPIIKLDWWSRPSRLPDFLQRPDRKRGVAMMERGYPSPLRGGWGRR